MSGRRHVREVWHEEVLRTQLVKDACRVLLLHMATAKDSQGRHLMTETGRIRVRREVLAEALGVNPKRITDRITEATRTGLLVKTGGGYNGQVAEYTAQPQARKVPVPPVPSGGPTSLAAFVKVPANGGPSESAEPVPSAPPDRSQSVTKVPTEPATYVRARARVHYRNRETKPAPDGSRVERDHDGTSQAGTYEGWHPTPSKRPSTDPTGRVA